jgi:hypothetical protein
MSNPSLLGRMACIMHASFNHFMTRTVNNVGNILIVLRDRLQASSSEGFRLLSAPPIGGFFRLIKLYQPKGNKNSLPAVLINNWQVNRVDVSIKQLKTLTSIRDFKMLKILN